MNKWRSPQAAPALQSNQSNHWEQPQLQDVQQLILSSEALHDRRGLSLCINLRKRCGLKLPPETHRCKGFELIQIGLLDRGADAGTVHVCPIVRGNARTLYWLYCRRPPFFFPFLFFILQNLLFTIHPLRGCPFTYTYISTP